METTINKHSIRFSRMVAAISLKISQVTWKKPSTSIYWLKTFLKQFRAHRKRKQKYNEGLPVPPLMICSVTNRCNLKCAGCYAGAQNRNCNNELSHKRYEEIFREAASLGTSIIMLAGGEPLLRHELLESAGKTTDVIFPVFTNGTLLRNGSMDLFRNKPNLIPVLSIEGDRQKTDARRGTGTYDQVNQLAESLETNRILYGLSVTLTSENYDQVLSPPFFNNFYSRGARILFFVEYVPTGNNDKNLCLTAKQKEELNSRIINLRIIYPALVLSLPGDEEKFKGCLAAGRGFVHLSSAGDLEACPFAPFSDINLSDKSLEDGLKSEFLEFLRTNHSRLKESEGGCTLWANRNFVSKNLAARKSGSGKLSGVPASVPLSFERPQAS